MTTWRAILILDHPDDGRGLAADSQPRGYAVRVEAGESGTVTLVADDAPALVPVHPGRARAALERLCREDASVEAAYHCHDLEIDFASRRVLRDGREVTLTKHEFGVLAYLARNAGTIRSIAEIFESVWRRPFINESAYLWTYIRRLRCKVEPDPRRPMYVLSRGGLGYLMARGDATPDAQRPPLRRRRAGQP